MMLSLFSKQPKESATAQSTETKNDVENGIPSEWQNIISKLNASTERKNLLGRLILSGVSEIEDEYMPNKIRDESLHAKIVIWAIRKYQLRSQITATMTSPNRILPDPVHAQTPLALANQHNMHKLIDYLNLESNPDQLAETADNLQQELMMAQVQLKELKEKNGKIFKWLEEFAKKLSSDSTMQLFMSRSTLQREIQELLLKNTSVSDTSIQKASTQK